MTAPLSTRGLTRAYEGRVVVNDVSLSVDPGQLVALLGPSGCGKTTTLRMIAGLEQADAGEVFIGGQEVVGDGLFVPPERRGVGLVFQQYALFPHLSVEQNVAFGLVGRSDGALRVQKMLDRVGLLHRAQARIAELSGGEQQRVALARALAPEPVAVLLDEPFANLDTALRQRVRDDVDALIRESGALCILVTHDQEEALALADVVAVMHEGRLLQLGPPDELYRAPQSLPVARLLGDGCELSGQLHSGTLTCPLGAIAEHQKTLPRGTADGEVVVFTRPESLAFQSGGAAGRVLRRRYHGPATRYEVELSDGAHVLVLEPGSGSAAAGDNVEVVVIGDVRLFNRDA